MHLVLLLLACDPAPQPDADEPTTHVAQLWTCGMHPDVVQDHPGQCPICGMDLTPMGETAASASQIHVPPQLVQTIGVRTEVARKQTIFRHLRAVGEVEVAEDEISVVNLRFGGWVERIAVDRTGDPVRRGQVLFDIYSPELVAAQEELLLAARTDPDGELFASARRKLELWDIAEADIQAVLDAGQPARTLPIRSPDSGYVLHKSVVEGARVSPGSDLYRIGDLARVWVEAEVYEHDAPWVEEGQPAQMELSFMEGEVLQGRVAKIYPTLNEQSRTLTVRLEFDNPGVKLKPGMIATVWIEYRRLEDVLAIPTEAIIHSGRRQLVFVAEGEGHFSPREVSTGLRADHHMTEIRSGLAPGEEVVTSAQFLLDSESQLQEALQKMIARRAGKPVPGEAPDTVWSCPMHPTVLQEDPGRCPECGMFLEERQATPDELARVYGTPDDADRVSWTCPMHPDVHSDKPGTCPDCGMFLEKRAPQ